jgi:hypothetical protein
VRTEHVKAIERQTSTLRRDRVEFEVWDAEELSTRLKTRPRIVLDFFGRPWVDEFCTEPLVEHDRLDAGEIATLRTRLRDFYAGLFARQDALLDDGTPISERFVEPDVLRIRHLRQVLPGKRDAEPLEVSRVQLAERQQHGLRTHRRPVLARDGREEPGRERLLRHPAQCDA